MFILFDRFYRALPATGVVLMASGIAVLAYQTILWILGGQWDMTSAWDMAGVWLGSARTDIEALGLWTMVEWLLHIPVGVILFILGAFAWSLFFIINRTYLWVSEYLGYY